MTEPCVNEADYKKLASKVCLWCEKNTVVMHKMRLHEKSDKWYWDNYSNRCQDCTDKQDNKRHK